MEGSILINVRIGFKRYVFYNKIDLKKYYIDYLWLFGYIFVSFKAAATL